MADHEVSYRMAAVAARDEEAFAAHWARIRSDADTNLRAIVADGVVAGHAVSWTGGEGRTVGYWIGKELARKLVDDGPVPGTFAELRFRLG